MATQNICKDSRVWKPVPEFEDIYSVSNFGEVKRIAPGVGRAKVGVILKAGRNPKGYRSLLLSRDGKSTTKFIHVLVCEVFHGVKPSPRHQAAHRDDDKENNHADNLYWATPLENHAARRRNGRVLTGSRVGRSKLKEADIPNIIAMREAGMVYREIGERFGVATNTISRIFAGKRWGHMVTAQHLDSKAAKAAAKG